MSHRPDLSVKHFSNIIDILKYMALQQPDQEAYTFLTGGDSESTSLTYGELERKARALGTILQQQQLSGERVLLLYHPGLDYIIAFFGCLYAGVIAVPAYPPQSHRLMQRLHAITENVQAAAILTTTSLNHNLRLRASQMPILQYLPCIMTDTLTTDSETEDLLFQAMDSTLAFLQYTSGSTAQPKGVMLTHGNILQNLACIQESFQQSPASRGVIWLPPYHDMGLIGGILQPLYTGFPVTLMPPMTFLQQPFKWLQTISNTRATGSGGPNFAYDLCVSRITVEQRTQLDLSSWEVAFCGAEPIHHETLERFATTFAECGFRREAFYPCYGLAEATLFVSGGRKTMPPVIKQFRQGDFEQNKALSVREPVRTLVGCGQSGPGQQVIIVHPDTQQLCRDSQVGEVWVASPSVAQGYWNDPEGTRYTFQAHLSDSGAGPFLRTGDLGVILDGELFIVGRLKNMLILRGANYYAEDIEQTIEHSLPGTQIGRCAAFSIEIEAEERLVIALEVGRHSRQQDIDEFTDMVHRVIAEQYELQVYAIALLKPNSLPRTSSGKLQRAACREGFLADTLSLVAHKLFGLSEATSAVAPRDMTLEQLLEASATQRLPLLTSYLQRLVAHFLHVSTSSIDVQNAFFSLGLDSLMIMEIKNIIEAQFTVNFLISSFFGEGSIRQLATDLLARVQDCPVSPTRAVATTLPETNEFPLSSGQQALWFLQQLHPINAAYNVAFAIQIQNELNSDILQKMLQTLVERHPALRTVYVAEYCKPIQRILVQMPVTLEHKEVADQNLNDWQAQIQDEVQRPFDLEHGPILRVSLWSLSEQEHILLCVAHHIAVDFHSLVTFTQEFIQLYRHAISSQPVSLPALPAQHTTYVLWQNEMLQGTRGEQLWKYWQDQLHEAHFALDLPIDRPRPPVQTSKGTSYTFTFSRKLSLHLKQLTRVEETTLYMLLLAAFQTLLYRYTAQEDIVVGSPAAGRSTAAYENVIGYFVNPIVLRAKMSPELRFRNLLQQTRLTVLAGLEHQDYPFPLLVERLQPIRDQSRSPIFQVMFTLYRSNTFENMAERFLVNTEEWIDIGNLHIKPFALDQHTAQFDLALSIVDVQGSLSGSFQYNTDLFEATTIQRMATHWQTLLEGIVAQPDAPLYTLPLLSQDEAHYLLTTLNQTQQPLAERQTLHSLFAHQAASQPEALAMVSDHHTLTYGELDRRANQLAHYLHTLGIHPEQGVGLALDRESPNLLVALLAILKAGATYVPLDSSYPVERLAFLCADAHLSTIITQQALLPQLPPLPAITHFLCLETMGTNLQPYPDTPPALNTASDQLAYVIYTSGSTGTPKGVGCSHRNALNTLAEFQRRWDLLPGLRWSLWTSLSFDVSIYEIFLPLLTGGILSLIPEALRADDPGCFTWLQDHQIQASYLPPFLLKPLQHWLARQRELVPALDLRYLLVGVEPIPEERLCNLMQLLPALRILNAYGPTETTICATAYQPDATGMISRTTPIGRPMQNVEVYVLDAELHPVPLGVAGDLYIGGAGVARGYLGRPDLTAARFLPHPWSTEPGQRLYQTGDVVRWLPEGELLFIRRNDQQIKLHGFRIELGEIETALERYSGIRESIALIHEHPDGDKRIVAYVTVEQSSQLSMQELRSFLQKQLPIYMQPTAIVCLDTLPQLPNGKLNKAALLPPDWDTSRPDQALVAPRNQVEELLAGLWREILHLNELSIYANFFDLGGHSLIATQLMARMQNVFQRHIPLQLLFQAPTIVQLAEQVELLLADSQQQAIEPLQRAKQKREEFPLSYAQQRLWFLDQLEPESAASNTFQAVRLQGSLDIKALEYAFQAIIQRHEILRTSFTARDGIPMQIIEATVPFSLTLIDLQELSDQEHMTRIQQIARDEAYRPFDLKQGPLLRAMLIHLGTNEYVLFLTMHHIISDAWSMGILTREMTALYTAFCEKETLFLPELPIQYADFAVWQRQFLQGEVLQHHLDYWKHQLRDMAPLQLPTDYPRPARQTFTGAHYTFEIVPSLLAELKQLSTQEGVTLYMMLLAAFQTFLHRYSGQTDIIIGSNIANRTHAELEGLIGFFINMLSMRTDFSGDPPFREVLRRVRQGALEAYTHQDLPFDKLVESLVFKRDQSRSPLFQVVLAAQNVPLYTLEARDVQITPLEIESDVVRFDLVLFLQERADGLFASINYNTSLFKPDTITRMATSFIRLLFDSVARPEIHVSELEYLIEEEKQQRTLEKQENLEASRAKLKATRRKPVNLP
jgi:amino acid adenylation domain-containing protein